jgi:type IX secretion system PorP/SprF family membrane protein
MEFIYLIRRSNRIILFAMFALLVKHGSAQNNQFSYTQYMDNLTPLNPAYSMLDKTGSINALVRKQWVGIEGAPTTFMFNGNLPFESINASAGLIVLNDRFAIENQTEINAYFAKTTRVGFNNYLAVSLNAGVRTYIANYSTLDHMDPVFSNDVRETKPNFGFGVMYFSDRYYIGLSLPELTVNSLGTASLQNNSNFTNHYYFSAAVLTDINSAIKFKPATLISYSREVPLIVDVSGTFYLKERLGLGVNYRTNSEMAGIISVNLNKIRFSYSFQFGTSASNLGGFNMPTSEVTLYYRFGNGALKPKLL